MLLLILFTCASLAAFLAYVRLKRVYNYWESRGVPHPKPTLLLGNTEEIAMLRTTISEGVQKIYQKYENYPFIGIYELITPTLLVRDPELIKHITIKDFHHFQDRGFATSDGDPLTKNNLVNLSGRKWHNLRTRLNSAFTSGKIRYVFGQIINASKKYNHFIGQYADKDCAIEFRDMAGKFTTEIMSTCYFGLDTNTLQDEDSEFRAMCKLAIEPSLTLHFKRLIRFYLPKAFSWLLLSLNPSKVTNYFMTVVRDIVHFRETNGVIRHDFMQLLMEMKNIGHDKNDNKIQDKYELIMDESLIAAQVYIFFLAGFETTATTIGFIMYELAANPDIQQRAYEEIRNALEKHGSFCYEAISDMKFLECIVKESLRKYPPLGAVPRICNEEYRLPGTDVIIEKGTKILIPIYAIHHDPLYYDEPSKFNPDRFMGDINRNSCTFLPFGAGPRFCIGMKLAYTQTKAGLVSILSDYEVSLSSKTSNPITFEPTAHTMTSKSGIWLKIKRRAEPILHKYYDNV